MAKLDMSKYNSGEVGSYKQVPPGEYLVKVVDCKVSYTRAGDEMWFATFEIVDERSEHYGAKLFDNIVFAPKAMNRAKLIFEAFEVEIIEGEFDYQPDDILGHFAKATVERIESYTDKDGRERKKSVIGFSGYAPMGGIQKPKQAESEDDLPF